MTTMAEVVSVIPSDEWVSVRAIIRAMGGDPEGVSTVCATLTAKGMVLRRQRQVGMRYLYEYRAVEK